MNYHNITKDDMLNGEGIRVVLWLAGCEHQCPGCQNPQTWDKCSGIPFDDEAKAELFEALSKDYIDGITFSGGDPMATFNRNEIFELIKEIKMNFPTKTVWCYTGYTFEQLMRSEARSNLYRCIDILVDGRFVKALSENVTAIPWRGSTNQRVIDVKKTFATGNIVLLPGTEETTDYSMVINTQKCAFACR